MPWIILLFVAIIAIFFMCICVVEKENPEVFAIAFVVLLGVVGWVFAAWKPYQITSGEFKLKNCGDNQINWQVIETDKGYENISDIHHKFYFGEGLKIKKIVTKSNINGIDWMKENYIEYDVFAGDKLIDSFTN